MSTKDLNAQLADKRRTFTFYVDDTVIDEFCPTIGVYGLAMYVLLVRHAKNGQCFPSYRLLTQKLGIGRATVKRTLELLEKHGLVTKENRKTTVGDADTNLYTIMDLSHLHPRRGSSVESPPSSVVDPPSSVVSPGVVPQRAQGGLSTELEGILIKESQLKEKNSPLSPQGDNEAVVRGDGTIGKANRKTRMARDPEKQTILKTHIIDASFLVWFANNGLTLNLEQEWTAFVGKALANGYAYVDWRQAFMNWLTSSYQNNGRAPKQTSAQRQQDLQAWAASKQRTKETTDA